MTYPFVLGIQAIIFPSKYSVELDLGDHFRWIGAQKTTEIEGSHILVPRPNMRGIPEQLLCRILLFMWPLGALQVFIGAAVNYHG